MLEASTGMKPGLRYCLENPANGVVFDGFFQDGQYFDSKHHRVPIGWLEGNNFIYNEVDGNGNPRFPNRLAGVLKNLVLTMYDGTTIQTREVQNG